MVPLIYADELIEQSPYYLNQSLSNLNNEIKIFTVEKILFLKTFTLKI